MPRQGPCRGPGKALAEDTYRAAARTASAKTKPPFPCSCQPNQLGRHLRGDMQLPGQISKHLRGGMQIFMKALPPRHLSCLPAYMALHASLVWARGGEAVTDGMGLVLVPNKANGHLCSIFNALCPVMPCDKLAHCRPFHLLCATVVAPFDYKRRPIAYWRRIRLFGTTQPP